MVERAKRITKLDTAGAETIAKAIEETKWNDESIASAVFFDECGSADLVTRLRNRQVNVLSEHEELNLYWIMAFLGLDKNDFVVDAV